jgi:hypothetical protein
MKCTCHILRVWAEQQRKIHYTVDIARTCLDLKNASVLLSHTTVQRHGSQSLLIDQSSATGACHTSWPVTLLAVIGLLASSNSRYV